MTKLYLDAMPSADWIKFVGDGDVDSNGEPVVPVVRGGSHGPKSLKYSEDQPRDDHGRFGSGGGDTMTADGVLGVGDIKPTNLNPSAEDIAQSARIWQYYNDCAEARFAAEAMLGQDHPTVPRFDSVILTTGRYAVMHNLADGQIEGREQDLETQDAVDNAHNLLVGVRDGAPQELPLYRGVSLDMSEPGTRALLNLRAGDSFDLSLASFSNDKDLAESFSYGGRDNSRMLFVMEPGARGTFDEGTAAGVQAPGGAWVDGHQDVITGGRLEVTSVGKPASNITEVHVRQVGVFDPDNGGALVHNMKAASEHYRRAPFWQHFGPATAPMPRKTKSAKYSEDQPRDERGRFGSGSGDGALSKETYYHVSPRPLAVGTTLTPGGGRANFGGNADSSAVYMAGSPSDAEKWGNAMAQDDAVISRLYVYEVRARGDVSQGTAQITNPDGFVEDVPEHRADEAVVTKLLYSYDPVTGNATYPDEKSLKYSEDQPRDERGRFGEGSGDVTARITVEKHPGAAGDRTANTRTEKGTLPTRMLADMQGVNGDGPGDHRQYLDQQRWQIFKDQIEADGGIKQPILVAVYPGEAPKIADGNARRDAAVELGLKTVPVEVRYYGKAEDEGTVAQRYAKADDIRLRIAIERAKYSEDQPRDDHGRFGSGGGADTSGPTEVHVGKTLDSLPKDVRSAIEKDFTERTGNRMPNELSPSWQNTAGWRMVQTDEAKALDDAKGNFPERYAPNRGFGVHLKDGEVETHVREGEGAYGKPPRLFDLTPAPPGVTFDEAARLSADGKVHGMSPMLIEKEGSERPPEHVYRVMSVGEYDAAKESGYIRSDERMNLGPEGTVTSLDRTGSFYEPVDGSQYRIARIQYRDEDGWTIDHDGYVKTQDRVPFDRIDLVTSPLDNSRAPAKSAKYSEGQPRDERGRFGESTGTPVLDEMRQQLAQAGGFTIDPRLGEQPHDGITVRAAGHDSTIVDGDRFFNDEQYGKQQLRNFMDAHAEDFFQNHNLYFGGWHDTDHNEVVLDVVERFTGAGARDRAVAAGAERDEQGAFDLATGEYIPTGGSGHEHAIRAASARRRTPDELARDDRRRKAALHRQHLRADEAALRALIPPLPTDDDIRAQLDLHRKDGEPDWTEVDAWLERNDVKAYDVLREVHTHLHPNEPFRYYKYSPDQERDDHGRFGSGSGDTTDKPTNTRYLEREQVTTATNDAPDHHITELAVQNAERWAADARGTEHGGQALRAFDDYKDYLYDVEGERDFTGELQQPERFEPGSAIAQSEAVTQWQQSFNDSYQMQVAADALMGYDGNYDTDERLALAREMLTMMANGPTEGAVSSNQISTDYGEPGVAELRTYGAGELSRGFDDESGSMLESFQNALDNDETIRWSMASFVEGDGGGDTRMRWFEDELGIGLGDRDMPIIDNEDTGEEDQQSGNENAAMIALRYTSPSGSGSPPVAPMLIQTDGTGLAIDGGYETVVGGEFKVVGIREATYDERHAWAVDQRGPTPVKDQPITVVQLHQVANVQLPPGVATT